MSTPMKLKEGQLRRIIREEMASMTQAPKKRRKGGGPSMWDRIPEDSPDYGRSSAKKLGHLSELKDVDPKAYRGFIDMLVEDCQATFEMDGDGKLTATNEDGTKLTWNPTSTSMDVGNGWEMNS